MEDPNEVVIQIEFASTDEAKMSRERLFASDPRRSPRGACARPGGVLYGL